jgi:hypothetical protein
MYIHHMASLVRKQVYLTAEQNDLLKRAAGREQRSEAEIIRSALDLRLRPRRPARTSLRRDPLWGIVAAGQSTARDVSENVDHYLYGAPRR